MKRRPLLLLSLNLAPACASDKAPDTAAPAETASPDPDSATEDTAPTDADQDGAPAAVDCDEADASVHPGAAERCDGVDQDCDGEIDEGVPGDGAGCQEPEPPDWDDAVHTVHVTVRTGDEENDGTDNAAGICLSATFCETLDNADWDDNNTGATDVFVWEGLSLSKRSLDRMTLSISGGSDHWQPTCVAVAVDGEPIYCRDDLDQPLGDADGEALSWTDGLTNACAGCFDAPLTHGPIVGATTSTSTNLWLRTDASRRVAVRVASSEGALADAAPAAIVWTQSEHDFAVQIPIVGLSPQTDWSYDLEIEGARYGPWTFRTPAVEGAPGALRFGFGSCTRWDEQPIFETILELDPDLFLFVGDNHYGNTDDLASNRQNYRWAHSRDGRAALMRDRPILATWDDHDYVGNNLDGHEPGRDTALRVFQEYWANASYGTPDTAGVFSEAVVGDVQFVLLDVRYHRGLDDSILGDAQEAWLLDTLLASDATFHVLVSGSQWTDESGDDSWDDYPDARARVLSAVAEAAIGGVVLLSGDVHRSELRVVPVADGAYDLPELTSSPLANSTSPCHGDADEIACYDDGNSLILVDVDTTLPDPTLTATIVLEDGTEAASWTILRSELGG